MTSSIPHLADVAGYMRETRERIHRSFLICDYYRLHLHAVGFQTAIRTTTGFLGFPPPRGFGPLCTGHCRVCVAQGIRRMLIRRRPHLPPTSLTGSSL